METPHDEGLSKTVANEAGDFIYIPAYVPHQPVNLSVTDPVEAIIARINPSEQESVMSYPDGTPDPTR